jgi:hypothetical protein
MQSTRPKQANQKASKQSNTPDQTKPEPNPEPKTQTRPNQPTHKTTSEPKLAAHHLIEQKQRDQCRQKARGPFVAP